MINRRYSAINLSKDEIPFKIYFEALEKEFSNNGYEIWIRNPDFDRSIAAGIINRKATPTVAATVWFKYGGIPVDCPINSELISKIRENLSNGIECEFNNS